MKIFKSIKWRLQLWYGLSLAITIMALIGTDYQLEQNRQFSEVDADLRANFGGLIGAMQSPPPMRPGEPFSEGRPSGPPFRGRPPIYLPLERINSYINNTDIIAPTTNRFYYVIWSPDGNEIIHSTNAPSDLVMPEHTDLRMRGMCRELISPAPGTVILVGRNIAPVLDDLHRHLLTRIAWGAWILCLGLFGGWWISSRAIRPISEISSAATKISAGDLSQRISISETESELGQLAAVLNSTFARLESAFAQQKQFASDAAHELRTPVSVILTQTQTALNRERAAADYKQTIEACQRAAQRMRKLIGALLELARLDAGQEQMKRLRFDFSKTVADCVELIRPLADEHGVKIFSELAPLEITGDSERLAQVVTNLLTNAIQFNHDGGEVRVKLESQNSLAVLTVNDTGQGIPAEDVPRVFERFYRADKSRSSGNAGLGLAISKAIVEAHSGTIEVSSVENGGTIFTVHLPA
jgi:two-component system, OmpR family, sensor kinase